MYALPAPPLLFPATADPRAHATPPISAPAAVARPTAPHCAPLRTQIRPVAPIAHPTACLPARRRSLQSPCRSLPSLCTGVLHVPGSIRSATCTRTRRCRRLCSWPPPAITNPPLSPSQSDGSVSSATSYFADPFA
ncbi:hypothetical protein C8R44DRAFT_992376 [Mycena epipterygia]|nr:hypothetical protein C8R44DRAFT_992376 [Mycena epipterygia]